MPVRTQAIDATLSADEWALVSALRALPDSPLKTRVLTLLDTLVTFIGEPRCARMQGDGVPCSAVDAQCDQCVHVAELIDAVTRRQFGEIRRAAERR
jgi:hypothetical protein